MNRQPQILLVEGDAKQGAYLKQELNKLGFVTFYCDSPSKAARLLQHEHYDFLLTDMSMPGISGIELILWAKKHVPRTQSVLMTVMPLEVVQMMAQQAGVTEIYSKPLDLKIVAEKLNASFQTGLSGKIKAVNLMDLLKIMLMDKVNREIQIEDRSQQKLGRLALYQGQVIHASLIDLKNEALIADGETGFLEIVKLKNAFFSEKTYNPDLIRNIEMDFQGLTMEVAKQVDETSEISLDVSNALLTGVDRVSTIMVIDDDPMIQLLMEKSLVHQGFKVITMKSAIEATQFIQSHINDLGFDLILTDVSMPAMSGLDFLLWLKEHQIRTPVFMMTAYPSLEIEDFAKKNNVLKFLKKPVDTKQLEQLIAEIGPTGFDGMIENINIFDFLQLSLMTGEQRYFVVFDQNNQPGHLYMDQGKFAHAAYLDKIGEEAFLAIVILQKGRFEEHTWQEPEQKSLEKTPPHKLLFTATRVLDQQNAFWPGSENLIAEIEKKVSEE